MHDHPHHHGGHEPRAHHLFEYRSVAKRKLILSLVITVIVMVVEIVGGVLTNSIALISAAGHMFTHAFAIIIGLGAIIIAQKPPCHHRTFGLYRAEILGAFINGLFLLLVVAVLVYEAVKRILDPAEVVVLPMLGVAFLGLAVNLASIYILHGSHEHDLNVKSVFYHMVGDAASSVGIVIGGVAIYYTGWNIIDPLISLGISAVIIIWAWGILKQSTRVLLEMAPSGLNIDSLTKELEGLFPEISTIYDCHLWTITPDMLVLSAHLKLCDGTVTIAGQGKLLTRMEDHLKEKHGIIETTFQIDGAGEEEVCHFAPPDGEQTS